MRAPDWNVVISVYDGEFREAARLLSRFGDVRASSYRNVLTMRVEDVVALLDNLQSTLAEDAALANSVSRVVPVTDAFRFASPEEFESKARDVVDRWAPELAGKKFHVRMHRRGFKGRLSSQHEEQFLDHSILENSKARGASAVVSFEDPDVVIVVETLGQEAGLSRWTREQLQRYELLRID
jgi:tRNA(Ser,Leu) C12 N-acetylase TAN1